jgi:hypothetical protein
MNKIFRLTLVVAAALFLTFGSASATTSTINPANPAQNSPLSSAVLRANFLAAYNDINAIYAQIANIVAGYVTSFNGRTGAVTAQSGDYVVGQVTGAAPLASPTFTGTVTLPAGQAVNSVTLTASGSASNYLNASGTYTAVSSGGMVYPSAGVANSTGSAWGTSYAVGTAANNLVQLNGSAQLPAVSAALLTNFPTFNQNTTGSAASFTGSLSGDVTGTQGATAISPATVTGKALTGFSASAGTVSATDSILTGINKIVGNISAYVTNLSASGAGGVTGTLPVANGGTGTSTPALVAGTNVTITGTWPNNTINASGGGGYVTSFNGRTGAVTAQSGDYVVGQVTGAAPLASPTFTGTVTLPAGQAVNSATLTAPLLGTPASGVLTNVTGLPLTTGVTGNLPVTNLGSGTGANSTTFWRGDATWATPTGSGTVNSGTTGQAAYYATSTSAVSGTSAVTLGTNSVRFGFAPVITPFSTAGILTNNASGLTISTTSISPTYLTIPDSTTTISATIGSSSMGGQLNFNGSSLTATIPAISSTVFATGMTGIITNYNATALTISTTPTINGCPLSFGLFGWCALTSNGVSLDGVGFPGYGTITSNALTKFTGTGGITTASSVTDNGTTVSTAEALTSTGVITGEVFISPPSTLTISTATFTPVAVTSNTYRVVLVHASCPCTIANPSGSAVDGQKFILELWQSATGSDTVTFGNAYDFGTAGAPTLTTTASKGDGLGFTYSAQNSKYDYIGIQQGW